MKIEIQIWGGRGVPADVVVRGDARGEITASDPLHAKEIAERLGDDTPAAIRDRCYSLVQSMADFADTVTDAVADRWECEACLIARDAGWTK